MARPRLPATPCAASASRSGCGTSRCLPALPVRPQPAGTTCPSKYAISIGTRWDCGRAASAVRIAALTSLSTSRCSGFSTGASAQRFALGELVAAPQRILGADPLDRPAVGHGEEVGPEGSAGGVEALGLLPQANEHVLDDFFGDRLVGDDPHRETEDRRRELAVRLPQRLLVTRDEALGPARGLELERSRATTPPSARTPSWRQRS